MLLRPTWLLLAAAGATLACVDPDPTAPSALVTPDAGTPLPVTLPIEVMPTTPEGLNNTGLADPAAVVARTIHLDAAAPNDAAGHGLLVHTRDCVTLKKQRRTASSSCAS